MDSLIFREIAKKYTRTYAEILVHNTKETCVVYFESFSPDDGDVFYANVHRVPKRGAFTREGVLKALDIKPELVRLYLRDFSILDTPNKKVFDFAGRTLIYTRVPNRQWRKGLCLDNCVLSDPLRDYLYTIKSGGVYKVEPNPHKTYCLQSFTRLFSEDYAGSLALALADIDSYSLMSRALDETYWIGLFPSGENEYLLYRHAVPVAFYNDKSKEFTLVNKIYLQEITDFCNRFKLPVKIGV